MGAKPAALCHLVKGKFVGGQRGFVDTFNWLVDFCANLKGDKDKDLANGSITVDTRQSDAPVIKLEDVDGLGNYDFSVEDVDGGKALVATKKKGRRTSVTIMTFPKVKVVSAVAYNPVTHKFTMTRSDVFVAASENVTTSTVFTAVQHDVNA